MQEKPNGCAGRHARWALGIIVAVIAVVVTVVLAMTNGMKAGQEKLDERLRTIEQHSASDSARIESMASDIRDIKRWTRPGVTGGGP